MEQSLIIGLIIFGFSILTFLTFWTFLITYKLFKMHDVKTSSGEYAWMFPSSWVDFQRDMLCFQKEMAASQDRIVTTIAESSRNHLLMSRLLESLVNATLAFDQKINGDANAKTRAE